MIDGSDPPATLPLSTPFQGLRITDAQFSAYKAMFAKQRQLAYFTSHIRDRADLERQLHSIVQQPPLSWALLRKRRILQQLYPDARVAHAVDRLLALMTLTAAQTAAHYPADKHTPSGINKALRRAYTRGAGTSLANCIYRTSFTEWSYLTQYNFLQAHIEVPDEPFERQDDNMGERHARDGDGDPFIPPVRLNLPRNNAFVRACSRRKAYVIDLSRNEVLDIGYGDERFPRLACGRRDSATGSELCVALATWWLEEAVCAFLWARRGF